MVSLWQFPWFSPSSHGEDLLWIKFLLSRLYCRPSVPGLTVNLWPSCVWIDFIALLILSVSPLTHWGRLTHICISKLTIIGSDNGLSPGRHQAIIWTNAGIVLIGLLGTKFSEILIEIHIFSFKKIHLNMLSGKGGPFCLSLNELTELNTKLTGNRLVSISKNVWCSFHWAHAPW